MNKRLEAIATLVAVAAAAGLFANPSNSASSTNGLCSLTLTPGEGFIEYMDRVSPDWDCHDNSSLYVGSHAYTVDGKFPGTVVTTPLPRSLSLTARTHAIGGSTRLTLHGRIVVNHPGICPPVPVVILARHNSKQPVKRIATVRTRYQGTVTNNDHATYPWQLNVRPEVAITYIAEVTGQRLFYFPAARCARPPGQVWANATSRPFTVRIQRGITR